MSRHAGISKIISAAALAFTVAACTSTAQSRPHQRPASADPIPASSRVAAAPSPAVGVTGLQVDGRAVTSGRKVAITGPVAARRVTGRFTATAPAGDRFFALTTPLTSAASYVQGEIIPGARPVLVRHRQHRLQRQLPRCPGPGHDRAGHPVSGGDLGQVSGTARHLAPGPALTWQTLATITVTRKPASVSSAPTVSIPPAVGVAGLVFDGRPVTSGRKVAITGPVAARRVTGRFTATAPAGDRFFALTTPLTSAGPATSRARSSPEPAGPGPSPSASAPTAATPLPRTGSRSCWPPRQWRRSWPSIRDGPAPCARSRP